MNEHDIEIYQSSKNDVWLTPDWIKHYAYEEQGCDFDPVPYQPEVDALETSWDYWDGRKPFYNPPHSKNYEFLDKLIDELDQGNIDAALVLTFTNTSVKWWEDFIQPAAHKIEFIARRVSFIHPDKDSTNSAMRPSSLIHIDTDRRYWHPKASCRVLDKDEQSWLKERAKTEGLNQYG